MFCFFLTGCGHNKNTDTVNDKLQSVPNRNPVKVMVLHPATFQKELISNGKLGALRKSVLKFDISEELTVLNVQNGDRVKKGEVIACLKQDKLQQALQQAEIQMEKSRFDLQNLLIGQGYQLRDSAAIPPAIFKTAGIQSGYTAAVNELQYARYNLRSTMLRAPFAGLVANIQHNVYEQVSASDEFCTLIDNSAYEVQFPVLETEIKDISPGKKIKVIPFAHDNDIYNGEVTEINPVVDENGLITIKGLIKNTKGLMEGMNVKVKIETAIPNCLIVPKEAVVIRQDQEVLFRYTAGKAFWTYVRTGFENSTSYTVTAHPDKGGTLAPGDTVIISGNLNLAHESEVEIE